MSDDSQDREISRPSLADAIDLLDLVRNSEEAARLSTEAPAPIEPAPITEPMLDAPRPSGPPAPRSIPPPLPPTGVAIAEEFVEVGDDAVDAPPSMPPERVSNLPRASTKPRHSVTPKAATPLAARPAADSASNAMPPAVSIVLVLGLAIGGLYGVLSWGSRSRETPEPTPEPTPVVAPAAPTVEATPTVEPVATPAVSVPAEAAAPEPVRVAVPPTTPRPSAVVRPPTPTPSVAPAPTPEPLRPEPTDLKVEGNPQQ